MSQPTIANRVVYDRDLADVDPEIANTISAALHRQQDTLEMSRPRTSLRSRSCRPRARS